MKFMNIEELREPFGYVMPDDSMEPVFEANDHLIIDPRAEVKEGEYALTMRPDTDGEPQFVIQKVIHIPEDRMTGSVIIGRVMSLSRSWV